MSTYTETQKALAESPAGKIAVTMTPGTRWRLPNGEVVRIWMGWTPDVEGRAEELAKAYHWGMPGPEHNTEIGISCEAARRAGLSTARVKVSDVGDWTLIPFLQIHEAPASSREDA